MHSHSDFLERLRRQDDLLARLTPTEPGDANDIRAIRNATVDELAGGGVIRNIELMEMVRAALFYAHDALEESHRIVRHGKGDIASYLHGMLHRREGDFDNARYWFRSAGELPIFGELHSVASGISPEMAKQQSWDPYLFTGLCEQEKFGDNTRHDELVKLQRAEFAAFFDYLSRLAIDPG